MRNFFVLFTIVSLMVCSEKESNAQTNKTASTPVRTVSMYDVQLTDRDAALNKPYELTFSVEKDEEFNYTLVTDIKLFGGSFFVSPHSTTEFTGRFKIDLAENEHLEFGNDFVEKPRSIEEIDLHRFVNGPVNWVSKDTRYEHPIIFSTEDDFEVYGKYLFTIEPKCTLEVIPFVIKHRSGKFIMEKWEC